MRELSPEVNVAFEEAAIVKYLQATWAPIEGLAELVAAIRAAGSHAGRGWVNEYRIGEVVREKAMARREALEQGLPFPDKREREIGASYDRAQSVLTGMWLRSHKLCEIGKALDGHWDYSNKVTACHHELCKAYPGLSKAKPLGWEELAKGYEDFDGQEEFDSTAACALFEGVNSESTASFGFALRVALPYVMYDDKCQGRKASYVLVGAIFAHFLTIREYMNTQGAVAAISAVPVPTDMVVGFDFKVESDNPFLLALASLVDPGYEQEDFDRAIDGHHKYQAMTDDEKAELTRKHKAEMLEMVARIRDERADHGHRSTEGRAAEQACKGLLLSLLV